MAIVAGASLGLSACSVPVALSDTNATLGGSQFLQVHFSANLFARGASAAKVIKVLKALNFELDYQSATGGPLASSLNTARSQVVVYSGTERVLTIVDVNSNEYLNVNIAALAHVPGLNLTPAKLAPINLILGSRWFEFPYSLVAQYENSTLHIKPTRTLAAQNDIKLVNALVTFFANQPTTTTTNGFSQSGTLANLESALLPMLKTAIKTPLPTGTPPRGTYNLSVTMNGSIATAAQIAVTAPNGKYGDGTLTLSATFAQANVPVSTPSGALVVTKSLLKQFSGGASGVLGGSLG